MNLTLHGSIDHQGASMDSRVHHFHDRGAMGSIGHTAILVGGYDGPFVEMWEFGNWRTVEDYPFGDSIYFQNIVTVDNEIIMSGKVKKIFLTNGQNDNYF